MPPCLIKLCKVIIFLRFFPTGAGDFICVAGFFHFLWFYMLGGKA